MPNSLASRTHVRVSQFGIGKYMTNFVVGIVVNRKCVVFVHKEILPLCYPDILKYTCSYGCYFISTLLDQKIQLQQTSKLQQEENL